MWGTVENRKDWLRKAIEFTGDHELYGSYMFRVINEWPVSCENALTDLTVNRKAWIGHAATALAIQCPEDITRQAWGYLNYEQQIYANRQAEMAISQWEHDYCKSNGIHTDVGKQMLLRWDT